MKKWQFNAEAHEKLDRSGGRTGIAISIACLDCVLAAEHVVRAGPPKTNRIDVRLSLYEGPFLTSMHNIDAIIVPSASERGTK